MSAKIKFPSSSSTPIKTKASEISSVSPSPVKTNKYRSFLTAVLTPSQTKKWLKRKKSSKSEESFKESKVSLEGIYKGSQISDDFCEPTYSSIQELQLKQTHPEPVTDSSLVQSDSQNVHESSDQLLRHLEASSLNTSGEPLYSTVNKQRKKIVHASIAHGDHHHLHEHSNEKADSERAFYKKCDNLLVEIVTERKTFLTYTSYENTKAGNPESLSKKLIEEQKEEIKLLVERMKELTKENRDLHKHIETNIREQKWKEDSLHAELKLKITKLEADTHKEVKCLSDQIKTLLEERKVLTDQIHILHEENKLLKMKYEDVCSKVRSMVSPEFIKKVVDEHEMLLNQLKKKHLEEMKKLQQENEMLLESKITLMGEVDEFKEKLQLLIAKNETLRKAEQELLLEKNRIQLQLDESKQMEQEAQNMLLSLLKITETISIERDVLLNKSSFQDHQQKLLQSTMMDYSLNMGRLQEHISTLSREKVEELQKLKLGESQRDESLKNFYGKQLDMLRSKVLNQTNIINDLESEKSKLELQLESLWQAACTEKPKIDDVK